MLPARCGRSILDKRVHHESLHRCPNLLFSPLIDCFMSQQSCLRACGSTDLHICSSHRAILFFFFFWERHKTSLSDWLLLRGPWIGHTHWLDLCGGKHPFLRIRSSLMQSMGEKSRKDYIEWVVSVELLSARSLDAQALKLCLPIQSGEHTQTNWQGSVLILRLVSPPFSLSLSVAADYDVHSLLSSWFWLASNQWRAPVSYSPCYCSPDHTRVHYWIPPLFRGDWLFFIQLTPEK